MTAPFVAGFARMVTATVGGWIVVEKTQLGLDGVFGAIALGMVVYGFLIAGSLLITPWRERGQVRKSTVKSLRPAK
jgi:MATE family, multidrug efflux pump